MTIEKEALEIVRYGGSDQFPDPGTAVYIIAKAIQKKQDRIDELEQESKSRMDQIVYAKAELRRCYDKINELEQIRMKLISKNMALSTKIKELESALKNCLATLRICESKKQHMPFSIQYVLKSIELAKKAIGGGNGMV